MSTVPDLSVEIAGIELRNPVVLASGTVGYGEEFEGLIDLSRVGAISVKGTSARPIAGNPAPRLFPTEPRALARGSCEPRPYIGHFEHHEN